MCVLMVSFAVMHVCVNGIVFASVSMKVLLDFGTVQTACFFWVFFHFILCVSNLVLIYLK